MGQISSRHIVYIVNPISGTRNRKDLHALIEKKTNEAGIPFEIVSSVANADYNFLLPMFSEKKTTDVVIAGGDGTVSQVVHSLMPYDMNFGIIPCGSGNGLAFTAGIPKQFSAALDIVLNGKASAIDAFIINDRFACMLSGLGFDAQVAHDFARQPKRGLFTYIKQVVKNFFGAKTYLFDIYLDDQVITAHAYFISIANSNQFGNNFTIAPQASLNDGLLDIVIVTNQNKMSLLLEMFKQVRGKNALQPTSRIEKKRGVIYFQAASLRIINRSRAPLHIDGDPANTPDEVNVQIREKCFSLIQPANGI
jgi:diacylglycerol kinase (ATP)